MRLTEKYRVENVPNPKTGANMSCIRIPVADLVEGLITPQKIRLRDRFFNMFRQDAIERTSLAPDHKTTEMGAAANVSDLGIGEAYFERVRLENIRRARYKDYDRMARESTVMERALDVTVGNMFTSREGDQESYTVRSDDARIQAIIDDLDRRVEMPRDIQGIVKAGLKYGDDFEELVVASGDRLIIRIKWLNPYHIIRNEDEYGRIEALNAFVQKDEMDATIATFHFWQVVHTRYNHERGNLYGTSFYSSARRPWKIVQVMEDGVAINRISRAIDRYVYYVPVPKASDAAQNQILVDEYKRKFRKRYTTDSTGRIDLTRAPFGDGEDIFLGVEPESTARVDVLKGSTIIGQLGDVEYFQNLEVMATGVPKSYLQLERDVTAQATLNNEDIEFARGIRTKQKVAAGFQREVYDRQLRLLGIPIVADQYTIEYPVISFVDEKLKWEVEMLKWEVATIAKREFGVPTTWILENIIGLDEEDIGEISAGLQEPVPGMASPSGPEIPARERTRVREQMFRDRRIMSQMADLRDRMKLVQQIGGRLVA